jgi:integrase
VGGRGLPAAPRVGISEEVLSFRLANCLFALLSVTPRHGVGGFRTLRKERIMASIYRKPVLIRDPKTGRKVKEKSKKWWGRFVDANGREKRVPLATDRAAAQTMLAEYVRLAEREKVGIIEPTDKHRKMPLSKHIADYQRHLEAKGNAKRYIEIAVYHVEALLTGCKFRSIADISPSKVTNWLKEQRDKNKFGLSTSNDYLVAVKAFCNWLVRDERLLRNPLAHLQRLNTETDIRRKRRVLTPDELDRLIKATEAGKHRAIGKFSHPARAMLYRLAAFTGLRAQELASLTAQSFDLDGNPPTVRVEACYSKHRRQDTLPLAEDLVGRLRTFLASQPAKNHGKRLWPGNWFRKAARMMRQDLTNARKAWIEQVPDGPERVAREKSDFLKYLDKNGCVADFHSLRHGFITYLVTANVPPKVAQTLARHSTITLTMDRYAHLGVGDLVEGLRKLPSITSDNRHPQGS